MDIINDKPDKTQEILAAEEENKIASNMKDLTPRRIVKELDKYIVGQKSAKKKVAIAMRNRYRRSLLPEELKEEVIPKNILMIGPTGVGKTEIARRLSRLANAPFTKVEATKYTEVGYVGRDVESMVRDLMEIGIRMVQNEEVKYVEDKAEQRSIDRILDAMKPMPSSSASANPFQMILGSLTGPMEDEDEFEDEEENEEQQAEQESRKKKLEKERDDLRQKIVDGELDNIYVEIEVEENPNVNTVNIFSQAGMEEMGIDFQSLLGNFMPRKTVKRNLKVKDAKKILQMEEAHKLIDREEVKAKAVKRVEQHGIIFIDEMDKVAGREKGHGPDVSREGVQRDILPIVEGSNVITKYGPVKTDHILFIAAGAFNISKPSDLIPELQGRFPIRVEMESLFKEDFIRILVEPRNALTKQYEALLASDGVEITFDDSGIDEMAGLAQKVNDSTENIGARRLHTILEKLLEDLAFEAPETENRKVVINREYVKDKLKDIVEDQDLTRFIL